MSTRTTRGRAISATRTSRLPVHLAHRARLRLRSCILLQPRSPARPRICASTSDSEADVRTVAAAASASINGSGASVSNVAAAASASINGSGAGVNNVAAAASASTSGGALPLMLADAAAATLFTPASPPLMLADAAASTLFTAASHPLMLADAAAATLFTLAPHPLMLADAAAATVLTSAPLSLVLAQSRGLAGLLGCSRMQLRSRGLVRCARCAGSTLLVLVALIALPLVVLVLIKRLFMLRAFDSAPSIWPSIVSCTLSRARVVFYLQVKRRLMQMSLHSDRDVRCRPKRDRKVFYNAGRRTDFRDESFFLESFFLERNY